MQQPNSTAGTRALSVAAGHTDGAAGQRYTLQRTRHMRRFWPWDGEGACWVSNSDVLDALNDRDALAAKLAQAEARCEQVRGLCESAQMTATQRCDWWRIRDGEFINQPRGDMYRAGNALGVELFANRILDLLNPPAAQLAPSTAECADEPEPGFPDPPCVRNGHRVAQSASGSQYCTRCGKRMGETGQTAPTTEGK